MKEKLLQCALSSCIVLILLVVETTAHLDDRLHYFETLSHVDLRVSGRQKRSVDGSHTDVKDVSFSAFGRDFNLVLTPGSPVISADLTARIVDGDGKSAPLYINTNQFFTGHLAENEGVEADAYTDQGLWTANIYEKDDVYILEPSNGHLPPSDNHSMIVYKQSDIKWENIFPHLASNPGHNQTICKSLHPEDEIDYESEQEINREKELEKEEIKQVPVDFTGSRSKRASPTSRNTCHIIAVADYTYYHGPGGGFPHQTANQIIQTLQKVNRIFLDTDWNKAQGLYKMGFQIKELRVHSAPTDSARMHQGLHYNMERSPWPDHDLLRQFGEDATLHDFCLAHLFTYRQFAGGVLGLAYIAPPRKYAVGGICSVSRGRRAMNTGFSSAMNTKGNNLLTQEATLVTTHEFGHNWGAEHDAETRECAPSSYKNGKFLMYPYAVSGFEENNYKFSPCSKRYITSVLATRSSRCFKKMTAKVPMCGNGIIDKGEDCDGGGLGLTGMDPCCTDNCKFKAGAACSPANHECCMDCQMAPAGLVCRGENKDKCKEVSYCKGYSFECPDSDHFDNGTQCIDRGECFGGKCMDYCYVNGMKEGRLLRPCICSLKEDMCKRCCKSEGSVCEPLGTESLQNGRPCAYGYCEEGGCKEAKANMIKRLFSFIENLDTNQLVDFMKANIVGTIIVFSIFVWVPLSWVISCVDKRHDKKAREQDPWLSRDALLNMSLQSQQFNHLDDYRIRPPAGPFRMATDINGRQYWTGSGGGSGAGGGAGDIGGSGGGGGGNREGGRMDGYSNSNNSSKGNGGSGSGVGGGGGGGSSGSGGGSGYGNSEYKFPPRRQSAEERTYKPRGKGDGRLDVESTV